MVERNRQRRPRPRSDRRRHRTQSLRGRVAGRVDTRHRGPAVSVRDDRPAGGQLAPERRRQPVRLLAPRAHEERVALLGGPGRELDPIQVAAAARQPPNRLLADSHARGGEQLPPSVAQVRRPVRHQDHVAAPAGHDERRADDVGAVAVHGQREVAHLPAVAERAVEDRSAPQRLDSRQRGRLVAQAVREHERVRAQLATVGQPHLELLGAHTGVDDGGVPHLDGGEACELLAPGAAQLDRREAAVAEQSADRARLHVCGPTGVEHQDPASRPPESQGGTQAGRAAPHDDRVQPRHPAWRASVTQAPPLAVPNGGDRSVGEYVRLAGHGRWIRPREGSELIGTVSKPLSSPRSVRRLTRRAARARS